MIRKKGYTRAEAINHIEREIQKDEIRAMSARTKGEAVKIRKHQDKQQRRPEQFQNLGKRAQNATITP